MTAGSEYEWNIVGGQIIRAISDHEVVVVWDSAEGQISVIERNSNGCVGSEVVKPIKRIQEASALNFSIFPNPAVDAITLSIETDNAFVQIVDVMGRVKFSEQVFEGTNRINIGHLAYGTYKVVLISEGNQAIKTLVIGN